MTFVKVTYIAINEDGKPLTSAANFNDMKKALEQYYGVDKGQAEYLGYHPYITKYPDEYEGYFEFKYVEFGKEYQEKVKIYCVEFFPHTIYEVNKNK